MATGTKTPTARFYEGRPVKRMYRVTGGIRLVLVGSVAGVPGKCLTITQQDWDLHGERREVDSNSAASLRELAALVVSSNTNVV